MTKYKLLKSYPANRKRDSWNNLGALEIVLSTKVLNADSIYLINDATSSFDGYLIYSNEFYDKELDWTNCVVEDLDKGYFSFENQIITPYFRIVASKDEIDNIVEPLDPDFLPYQELKTSKIKIPDDIYEQILNEIGVPFITEDELEYTRQEILDLMIAPAFDIYFKWFPIIETEGIFNGYSKKYLKKLPPDAYGVHRITVNLGYQHNNEITNPLLRFQDEYMFAGTGYGGLNSHRSGRGKSFANLQGYASMELDTLARQSIINKYSRVHFKLKTIDGERYAEFWTNKKGMVEIYYAKKSDDFMDIDFARVDEVIKLAKAKVLLAFGKLRAQAKSEIPGTLDSSEMISSGKELEKEVIEKWENFTKATAVVSSFK